MQNLIQGFLGLCDLQIVIYIVIGMVCGIFIGAIPGLNDQNMLTLFLPISVFMEPFPAIILMTSLFVASQTAGSIPAILINIPGTPSTAATTFEGFPLTKKGLPAEALGCSFASSMMGSVLGGILALILAPILGAYALSFGPPEMFMLTIFGMTAVASLTGNSLPRGLLAAVLGLLISTIGVDYFIGLQRSTFGIPELYGGISQIPMLLGLFGVAEIYNLIYKKSVGAQSKVSNSDTRVSAQLQGLLEAFRHKLTMFYSTVIGFIIGVIPGTGATIASFTSYGMARSMSKSPEKFGTGIYEGLVATDTANNACVPGAIVPTLTLGVPGSGTTVLYISVFLMHGLTPGPTFFNKYLVEANSIFLTVVLIGILATIAVMLTTKYLVRIISLPTYILSPLIGVFCIVGCIISRGKVNDLYVMLAFSILAVFLKKFNYSIPAFLLGAILGSIAEPNFFRSLALSNNDWTVFFASPICIVLWVLSVITVLMPLVFRHNARVKAKAKAGA